MIVSTEFLITSLVVVLIPGTGVIYLLYMAWAMWRETGVLSLESSSTPKSMLQIAIRGFLINILNPTFLIITFTVTSVWALLAGNVGGLLQSRRALQSVSRTAGGLMITAGVGLALARRGN